MNHNNHTNHDARDGHTDTEHIDFFKKYARNHQVLSIPTTTKQHLLLFLLAFRALLRRHLPCHHPRGRQCTAGSLRAIGLRCWEKKRKKEYVSQRHDFHPKNKNPLNETKQQTPKKTHTHTKKTNAKIKIVQSYLVLRSDLDQ